MNNAIIVHGMPYKEQEYYNASAPSPSNSHRIPWLQNQLLVRDREAFTPEMFHAYDPQYHIWQREFERFDINENTVLVGHSCGGGFLLRWLSEHPDVHIKKLVLVAPWIDRS
jgi:predicted alpha/beta hydrolase family esterase